MVAGCVAEVLDCSTLSGELVLAGWSLHTGAWCAWDLSELLSSPEVRGESVLVESEPGRSARPVLPDETEYDLPMVFSGAVDRDGTPWQDPHAGLATNRADFLAQIVTGQVIAGSLTTPDGVTVSGDAVALRLAWEQKPQAIGYAVLRLRVSKPWIETDGG